MGTNEVLALELRVRFLSLITSGPESTTSITRRTKQIQQKLETGIEINSINKFIQDYDQNQALLRLPSIESIAQELNPETKAMIILESSEEIIQFEQQLRQIQLIDSKEIIGSPIFSKVTNLQPNLSELKTRLEPLKLEHDKIDERTEALLQRYNNYIRELSELFISWNSIITAAEEKVTRLERKKRLEAEDL